MFHKAILDRVALGQCATNASDNVDPGDATDDLAENAGNVLIEAHRDDVAVADGRNRRAPVAGGGVDVEGEAGVVRRVGPVVESEDGISLPALSPRRCLQDPHELHEIEDLHLLPRGWSKLQIFNS